MATARKINVLFAGVIDRQNPTNFSQSVKPPTIQGLDHWGICLRPYTESDHSFLESLFTQSRAQQFASLQMPDQAIEELLRQQFALQHQQVRETEEREQNSTTVFSIVEQSEDSQSIGKFFVSHRTKEIRIVDIEILPRWQRLGIGRSLLESVLRQGEQAGKPVTLHVAHNNPVKRLYERLGFRAKRSDGVHIFMERCISKVTASSQLN